VGAQIIFPENGRGLGHVTPTIFGSTVGYPSDSLASCSSVKLTLCPVPQLYRLLLIAEIYLLNLSHLKHFVYITPCLHFT